MHVTCDSDNGSGSLGKAAPSILCLFCYRRNGTESWFNEEQLGRLCEVCSKDLVQFIRLFIESSVTLRRKRSMKYG